MEFCRESVTDRGTYILNGVTISTHYYTRFGSVSVWVMASYQMACQ